MMIYSIALSLLLGFELSYYLLIVQTGIAAHYNSDLITLFPMFAGGVFGTWLSGASWGAIQNPIHKIFIALSLQIGLSFLYPDYPFFTLALLGLEVGVMAPLGIYLFKAKQQKELFFALAIAYTTGTSFFMFDVDLREPMAVLFTVVTLVAAFILKDYKVHIESKTISHPFVSYLPLMLWLFLDSNLFETLSRHEGINIWSKETSLIMIFHLSGLVAAYYVLNSTYLYSLSLAAVIYSLILNCLFCSL